MDESRPPQASPRREHVRQWWREQRARVRAQAGRQPEHRWGLGAFFAVYAVYVLSAVVVSVLVQPRRGPATAGTALIGTIAPSLIAAVCALAVASWRGNGPRIDFALRWRGCWRAELRAGVRYGVLAILVTVAAALVWQHLGDVRNPTSAVASVVAEGRFTMPQAVLMFVYTWLIAPVCEEIIFRGMCWGALARWGPFTAFALSTAMFALAHLEPARTLLLLVIGIPIGLARLLGGSTTASIVTHQLSNFLPALAMLLLSTRVLS